MFSRTCRLALLAFVGLLATTVPASAAAGERHPPHLACLDVIHGTGTLSTQGLELLPPIDGDTVKFAIELAAPSCPDGTYRFEVLDGGELLASEEIPGDGSSTLDVTMSIRPDDDGCVKVQVTTIDSKGRTIDVAPDTGTGGDVCGSDSGGSVWR